MALADRHVFVINQLPLAPPGRHWSEHPELAPLFAALLAAGYPAESQIFARLTGPGAVEIELLRGLTLRGCELVAIGADAQSRLQAAGLGYRQLFDPRDRTVRESPDFYRVHVLSVLWALLLL